MPRIPLALGALIVLLAPPLPAQVPAPEPLPLWRESGVCYEVFVRSVHDSDGDGVGDFRGLIEKLDYINDGDPATDRDLGATCIWLMPIAQSPSYHGYDVTNYCQVNRGYGTNDDLRAFMAEARHRGVTPSGPCSAPGARPPCGWAATAGSSGGWPCRPWRPSKHTSWS